MRAPLATESGMYFFVRSLLVTTGIPKSSKTALGMAGYSSFGPTQVRVLTITYMVQGVHAEYENLMVGNSFTVSHDNRIFADARIHYLYMYI
eukprot:632888-Amphidinium_carterae.1